MTRQRLLSAALLLAPYSAFAGAGETLQRVGQAAGPFHLVILHLPIGLLAAVFLLDLLSLLPSRRDALSQASLTLQWIGAPLAFLAALTGFLLSKSGDYTASALMERHMWLGIGVAMMWFAMVAVRQAATANPTVTRYLIYTFLLFSNGALTILAGHDGGTLVHGEGFLSKNLPARVKSALCLDCTDAKTDGAVEAAASTPAGPVTVYQAIVAPILEAYCIECHGPKKVKGDLRLDSPEAIQKGGEQGAAITAGDPTKSSLFTRTVLPHDHDDIMPPGKKTKLTADQAKLLEWWIKQGASFESLYDKSALPAELQAVVDTAIPAKPAAKPADDKAPPVEPAKPDPAVALAGAIAEIEKTGGSAVWTAAGSGELQVDFRGAPDSATDALMPLLAPVREQLVSLTLSRGKITPAAIPALAGFPKLARLAVDNTAVDDASLDTLTALPALESLNLVGTGITDAGAAKLAGAKALKKVFLWQSKVTTNGVAALRKARPDLAVDDGWQPEDDAKPVAEGAAPAEIAAAAAAGPKTTFSVVVAPILEKNCNGCHGAEKAKGDLRLHTVDAIKAGGKGGPVVVAGDPAKSPLCVRVSLAHGHDDIMPPGDKPKLSPADIKRIAWWIQDGAAFDKPYDEKAVPADIKPAA
jgi:mono/diheme cytochrome c family protein/uncharacterized membrane protein